MSATIEDLYKQGTGLVWPFLHFSDLPEIDDNVDKTDLLRGIDILRSIQPPREFWELDWILGKSFEAAGDIQNSFEYFAKALQQAPNIPEVVLEFVIAALRVNMHAEALSVASRAVSDSPDNASLLYAAALASASVGQIDQATMYLDKLKLIKPQDSRAEKLRHKLVE